MKANAETTKQIIDKLYRKWMLYTHDASTSTRPVEGPSGEWSELKDSFFPMLVDDINLAGKILNAHRVLWTKDSTSKAIDDIRNAAHEMVISSSVLFSGEDSAALRIELETGYIAAAFENAKVSIHDLNKPIVRIRELESELSSALRRLGYLSGSSRKIASAAARLVATCELFVNRTDALLSARSKWPIYSLFCQVFGLTIELYACSFEVGYLFRSQQISPHTDGHVQTETGQ